MIVVVDAGSQQVAGARHICMGSKLKNYMTTSWSFGQQMTKDLNVFLQSIQAKFYIRSQSKSWISSESCHGVCE